MRGRGYHGRRYALPSRGRRRRYQPCADRSQGGHGLGAHHGAGLGRELHRGRLRGEPRDRPGTPRRAPGAAAELRRAHAAAGDADRDRQRGDSYRQGGRVSGDSGPRAGARGPASSMARGRCAESQRDGGRIDFEQPRARCAIGPGGGGSAPAATGTEGRCAQGRGPWIFRRRRCRRRGCALIPRGGR